MGGGALCFARTRLKARAPAPGRGSAVRRRAIYMHVLMTADTVGGVWTYAQELVTALVHRGVRVTLVSLGEMPGPEQT